MLALWLFGSASAAPEMIPEVDLAVLGTAAPDFEADLLSGGSFKLGEQRGKVVVLAFWASWCGPCQHELPALDKLAAQRPEVEFFAVNVDRDSNAAKAFLRKIDVSLPVVWDHDAVALGSFGVTSMPTTYVIDQNGTVKYEKSGYSRTKGLAELETALDGLL